LDPRRKIDTDPCLSDQRPTPAIQTVEAKNRLLAEAILSPESFDDAHVWNIVYYTTVLGRIDRQTGKITGSDNV